MRKFFFGLGVLTACLVVAGGIGLFFLARNGMALDAESKAYVDKSVAAITDDWDADALWQRSSPRFRQTTKQDDLRNFFDAARESLGRLVAARGATGQATISVVNAVRSVTANYMVHAQFEKGDADIQIGVVKNGSHWRIEGFHIDSSTLMRSLVGFRS
jgi:hypothetical protein